MKKLLFLFFFSFSALAQDNLKSYIANSEWVQQQLANPNIVIIDVRARDQYDLGHIKGAINLPVDDTFDKTNRVGLLASISTIQSLFSQSGINNDMNLVLYDSGKFIDAARLFWVFEVFGHQQISILNLGFSEWKKKDLPVSTVSHQLPPATYIPTINSERLATSFSTRLAIEDKNKTIIDARSTTEYLGQQSKATRFGHIPNAINIPWDKAYQSSDQGNKILALDDLSEIYSDIDKDSRIITYCNKGKQSALTYFVLRNLGYNVSAYDGSWSEWGNSNSLPIIEPQNRP